MAASIAGVFWRAARPSDLAYRHTSLQRVACVFVWDAVHYTVSITARSASHRTTARKRK